eukprot:jgi/Antlo1/2431/2570
MFERYLKRERKRADERINYKVKKLYVSKTHGEKTLKDKIICCMENKRLRKRGLQLILRAQHAVLEEAADDAMPLVLDALLDGSIDFLKAVAKLAAVFNRGDVLLKYFKCYVANDQELAYEFLKTMLRSKRTWVFENKAEICTLVQNEDLQRRILSVSSVENIKPGVFRLS